MKAKIRIKGITGLALIAMMLMFFTETVDARKRPGSKIVAKTSNNGRKVAIQTVVVESEKNLEVVYSAPITMWTIVEPEEELFVEEYKPIEKTIPNWFIVENESDLEVSYVKAKPLWNLIDSETELAVEDFRPTEKIIPFWMIVEEELELEVTDL